MSAYTEVLFEELKGQGGDIGLITLNRPAALNALNHDMVHAMHARLRVWATQANIKAVVIRAAEGRAFCAGGDLRLTFERQHANDEAMTHFFRDEYQLNRCIFHFPKPYIAFLDGITMGGGVGISLHGSHRVATDRLLFAMPETGIGFFTDVGGTYFLPRLFGYLGFYLGLAGIRIKSDDCVRVGLTQFKVPEASLPLLLDALVKQPFQQDAKAAVSAIIQSFSVPVLDGGILEHREAIDACFALHSMEEILQALHHSSDLLCNEAAIAITKKSPTSLKVTLRALQEGKQQDFDTCMRHEYRLAARFLEGHDFKEGIRAVIIDKDQAPKWVPTTLHDVSRTDVEHYFTPLTRELA